MIAKAKQVMLFDFHNMVFKNVQLEVANQISLSTQSLPLHSWKFPLKRDIFYDCKLLYLRLLHREYTLCCVEKWMRWKSYETDSYSPILKFGKSFTIYQWEQNKRYGCNMGTWVNVIYLFMLWFMHLFIDALVWDKSSITVLTSVLCLKL